MNSVDYKKVMHGAMAALLVAALVLAGLPQVALAQLPTATPFPTVDPAFATPEPAVAALPAFAPGELLVGVRTGPAPAGGQEGASAQTAAAYTTAEALAATAAAAGAQVGAMIDTTGPADSQVTYLLQTEPGQEYAVANELLGKPGVVYVEPNWYVTTAQEIAGDIQPVTAQATDVIPGFAINDPLYADRQWNMQRINGARAWQMVYALNSFAPAADLTVAVLDTGIDTTHPDFAGRLLPGYNYIGIGNPPMRDGFGHGTHVAGILAAGLNDAVGVVGVAPEVKIAPYRVLDDAGSGTIANVAAGLVAAANDGAQIINMSLTTGSPSTTLQNAVEYAASQGALLLAAAGNGGAGAVYWPAAYPEVMAVAALDYNDHRTSYSNYGPQIEIAAPGGDLFLHKVFSTWSNDALARCAPADLVINNGAPYCTRSGTSQATPAVAGAAALLWSLKPSLTAADIRALLRNAADELTEATQYVGAGKLNVANALREILPSTIVIAPSAIVTSVVSAMLPLTLTVEMQNPSLDAVNYTAALDVPQAVAASPTAMQGAWITMTSGLDNVHAGAVAYGNPAYVTLLVSPTQALTGTFSATLDVTGERSDGSSVQKTLTVLMHISELPDSPSTPGTPVAPGTPVSPVQPVVPGLPQIFVPIIRGGSASEDTIAASTLEWLKPEFEADRTTYALTDTGFVDRALPAGIKVGAKQYAAARIYADGFVAVAGSISELAPVASVTTGDNRCVPSLSYPAQGVFGWWADLDPGAFGARVSSFMAEDGRFVIAYEDVPAAAMAQPYTVSFQIVFDTDGSVGLNYLKTPRFTGKPGRVTVGIEGQDALTYSLFGCVTPTTILGTLPSAGQSYTIEAADIF